VNLDKTFLPAGTLLHHIFDGELVVLVKDNDSTDIIIRVFSSQRGLSSVYRGVFKPVE
jgi:hypothetical protein